VTADELKQMLQDLMLGVQESMMSGEFLSQEMQMMLAETMNNMVNKIEELRVREREQQEQPPPPTGEEPSQEIQLLWVLAGQQEQAFISYLRSFPSAETNALLGNPTRLSEVLEYLLFHNPPSPKVPIDGIPHADLNSSNVWGSAYDRNSREMKVRFQSGEEYKYFNIPPNIYKAFQKGNAAAKTKGKNKFGEWWPGKVPSAGAALHQYIKQGGYPYERIA